MALNPARALVRTCRHDVVVGDAFAVMADLGRRGRRFDVVVVDPPSFASRQSKVPAALHAYGRLTGLAVALARAGRRRSSRRRARAGSPPRTSTPRSSAAARVAGRPLACSTAPATRSTTRSAFPEGAYLKAIFANVRDAVTAAGMMSPMAAPKFAPVTPLDRARGYESPDHVPDPGAPTARPRCRAASRSAPGSATRARTRATRSRWPRASAAEVRCQAGESVDDALSGCTADRPAPGVALRPGAGDARPAHRAHDLGLLRRRPAGRARRHPPAVFEGVANSLHHYEERRALVDSVPEATLRQTPDQVRAAYPAGWRTLLGR